MLATALSSEAGAGGEAGAVTLDPSLGIDHIVRYVISQTEQTGDTTAWLICAVLLAEMPEQAPVRAFGRQRALDGADDALTGLLRGATRIDRLRLKRGVRVEVLRDTVTVDVWITAQQAFTTGIQRVVREMVMRWDRDHDVVLVGWTEDHRALRRLRAVDARRATGFDTGWDRSGRFLSTDDEPDEGVGSVVVPWGGIHVVPELAAEQPRAAKLASLGELSPTRVSLVGYDCVPISSAETVSPGMGGHFANYVSAVKWADRIATDSHSAAAEYSALRDMIRTTGIAGPDVRAVPLPEVPPSAQPAAHLGAALSELVGPLVVSVGSHEPRKNHATLLHCAEVLWREGHEFALAFIGGRGWRGEAFEQSLRQARANGRQVIAVSGIDDDTLHAAYLAARCVAFPSLHEGFGLPVAESLACGTPVITSNFGSMREIAEGGGAIMVDPRDDAALSAALRAMLEDDSLHARLSAEARARPERTWEDFAREAWDYLVAGYTDKPARPAAPLATP